MACNLPSGLATCFFFIAVCVPVVSLSTSFFSPVFFYSVTPFPITVVCYQSDRDELRRRVIQWLEAEIIPDGWFSKGSNYSEVLDKYFKASRVMPASEQESIPCPVTEKQLQCMVSLSSCGTERPGVSCSMTCYRLPTAAVGEAIGVTMGQPIPGEKEEGRSGLPVAMERQLVSGERK